MAAQVAPMPISNGTPVPPAPSPQPTLPTAPIQQPPAQSQANKPRIISSVPALPLSSVSNTLPLSARKSAGLDLATVERRGVSKDTGKATSKDNTASNGITPVKRERLHGIQEAPVFRPTLEDFENGPIDYIQKIRPEGEKYGIVKIIPPEGWNPPFSIDSEKFHFRTRKQELNQTDGGTRANLNYLDNLAKFHKQRSGTQLNRFPSVDKRPLDLYKLKKYVEDKGGFDSVCRGKRWAEIGRDLGYSGKIMSSLSTSLKNSYQKWLQPYEDWLKENKPAVIQAQQERENGTPYTPSPGPASQHNTPRPLASTDSAIKASQLLHARLNDAEPTVPQVAPPLPLNLPPPPPPSSGFTAVNSGGFTAVNAPPPPSSGFAAINAPFSNGYHPPLPQAESSSSNGTVNIPAPIVPNGAVNGLKRPASDDADSISNDDENGRRSKRPRKGDSNAPTVLGSQMMQPRLPAQSFMTPRDRSNDKPGDCDVCGKDDTAGPTMTCDSCDCTYHTACLDQPAKTAAPEGDWHCQRCLVGTQEFGFEEGGTYSLRQFQEKARNFKNRHFAKKFAPDPATGDVTVSEDEIEKEFWRLTESLTETVEVEYGADIHSTTHGSGFPTIERLPFNKYSTNPWNLNVMPLERESLFRHIKTDISGMTVPWVYVGMCFSTFCWHNEDHYTYSANYQHFGETKTWYGIPSGSSDRFEAAMREAVPELFEQQPDLLFQLVTLLQPEKLKKAGVDVYALDQHAGEFVITFPQAYHAGFNHGFNFNEAVNFAPSDWEPYGASAVDLLQEFKRQPVFSHDELLFSAAEPLLSPSAKDHCIKTAKWLAPALRRVFDREFSNREYFASAIKDMQDTTTSADKDVKMDNQPFEDGFSHVINDKILPDEETVCAYCRCYGYLSRFVCKSTGKVLCLRHADGYDCCSATAQERLNATDGSHETQLRYTAMQLIDLVEKVTEISETPETWAQKLDALLEDEPTPNLKNLRTIMNEGEKIDITWPLPRLADLKDFVHRCQMWIDEANLYNVRKPAGRRKSEMRSRGSVSEETKKRQDREEAKKDALHNPDSIKDLLKQAHDLGFECPELDKLQARYDRIQDYRKKVNDFLRPIDIVDAAELVELLEEGKEIDMDIPEIKRLEHRQRSLKWYADAQEYSHKMEQDSPPSLEVLTGFIDQGKALDVAADDSFMRFFLEKQASGIFWEGHAREVMDAEVVNYHMLDGVYKQAKILPVASGTVARIEELLKKQRQAEERLKAIVDRTRMPNIRERPTYKEVRETMEGMQDMNSKPPGILDLEREVKRHEDWMRRGKKLFGKANAPLHILLQHMHIVHDRNASCLDVKDQPRGPVEPASREHTPEESAIEEPHNGRDVFCICRRPESGMMIECELCHEWYHGRCLKIARGKVKEDDKYTCPICDYRVKIPRDAARPKLEELQMWQDEVAGLPFQPEEEDVLSSIIENAEQFKVHIAWLINPISTGPDDLSVQRFYLRKIEGADVLLAEETNFLRQQVHKWAPVAPEPPKLIEVSLSTRKPRPTKAQKLMNKMGVNSIDDLPEHLRPKAPKHRRHPHPDGHRSGKGSIPANPSSNAKPGESIVGRPVYPRTHTPPGHPRVRAGSASHSAPGSTSGTSRAPSNPTEPTPVFTFGGEMSTPGNQAPSAAYAPPSPLFGTSTDPYIIASSADNSRNAYSTASHPYPSAGPSQSIDPQLDNMFAHPSGMNASSPDQDAMDMGTNTHHQNGGDIAGQNENMDNLFNTLTENPDEFEFTNQSFGENETPEDAERYP